MGKPRVVPAIIFVFINFLFVYKYSSRVIDYPLIVSLVYSALLFIGIFSIRKIPDKYFNRNYLYLYLLLYFIGYVFLLYRIPVENLRVDRWSVIYSFLDALFSGKFPYLAKSHLNNPPGPFPFYFVLAMPFYFIVEIGYLSILGLFGFVVFSHFFFKDDKSRIIIVLLLSTAPAFLWEIIDRSTIVVNVVLLLFYLYWMNRKVFEDENKLAFPGLLGGFLLSTRGILALPLISFFSYAFLRRRQWRKLFFTGGFLLIGFLLTLLPLLLWNAKLFLKYNPITLQASFIWPGFLVLFLFISVFIGLKVDSLDHYFLYTGLFLFLVVGTTFLSVIVRHGWTDAIFHSGFDISYLLFSLPFLLVSIPGDSARTGIEAISDKRQGDVSASSAPRSGKLGNQRQGDFSVKKN